MVQMEPARITVFLADDNVIVREGVRALLALEADLEVVGTAPDYDELVAGADAGRAQVLVTDIRMPPNFQSEGIDAAKELRKRHPGTGVVVLSQYDDPVRDLAARRRRGRARLPAEGPRRRGRPARPRRPARSRPAARCSTPRSSRRSSARHRDGELTADDEELLRRSRPGADQGDRRVAAHDARGGERRRRGPVPEPVAHVRGTAVAPSAPVLHAAIVDREEQGETLSRLLPTGVAEKVRREGRRIGETEELDRHRAHVRRPRLLGHRRAAPTRRRSRASSTSTAPR